MFTSLKLGRFFGIDVFLHWTFWLIPALVFINYLNLGGLPAAVFALLFVMAAFACILLHEFGHALTARRFGIPTRDITLYPIGGVARLERLGNNAWEEFWIALAGPTVNVAIAVLLASVLMALSGAGYSDTVLITRDLLDNLLLANVAFVVFNLIPAFPMDGGRILRSLLVHSKGYLRATEIAARVGGLIATGFVLLGVVAVLRSLAGQDFFASPLLILVGLVVNFMGRQELAMVRYREAQRYFRRFRFQDDPVTVQPVDDVVVKPIDAQAGGFTGFLWDERSGRWMEWQNGRPARGFDAGH